MHPHKAKTTPTSHTPTRLWITYIHEAYACLALTQRGVYAHTPGTTIIRKTSCRMVDRTKCSILNLFIVNRAFFSFFTIIEHFFVAPIPCTTRPVYTRFHAHRAYTYIQPRLSATARKGSCHKIWQVKFLYNLTHEWTS